MSEVICIKNIERYISEIINGDLILTPKNIYITEEEFNETIISNSTILKCLIKDEENNIISNKLKYRPILNDIWISMPTQKILQTTTFNMKLTDENGKNGYNYIPTLKISIQGKDAKNTMKEIIKMVKLNNYSLDISIELKTKKIINFKLNID